MLSQNIENNDNKEKYNHKSVKDNNIDTNNNYTNINKNTLNKHLLDNQIQEEIEKRKLCRTADEIIYEKQPIDNGEIFQSSGFEEINKKSNTVGKKMIKHQITILTIITIQFTHRIK